MVKILVVDDVDELRSDMAWAAEGVGREVIAASSAEQAIQLILEQDFDVIVADLKMETESAGLSVLEAAKKRDPYTQVIIVTSFGTPKISVETMKRGAFDYLERNAPDTDHLAMVRSKIDLALEFRDAKLGRTSSQ